MPPSLSELKLTPSFCFAFKIPDNVTATSMYIFELVFTLISFQAYLQCLSIFRLLEIVASLRKLVGQMHLTYNHGLRTPNEGINQRNLKIWADVADKICFGRT